jgi:hypothetical protein
MKRTVGLFGIALLLLIAGIPSGSAQSQTKTRHVIFVMTDGLRWQEVFRGAEEDIINKKNGKVADGSALRKSYWRDTADARRGALMPFLWTVVAKEGQVYGNRDKGSDAFVTNGLFFSYPGYNETLCGFPDKRVDSNDKKLNPNVTVLEWLNNKPAFHGKIAAFGAWDLFPWIFNSERSGLIVNAGWDVFTSTEPTPALTLINKLKLETPRIWEDEPFDAIPFYTALEYLKQKHPDVLYISLGETDDWAHGRDYKNYLDATHRVDDYLRVLWETIQSMPEYRGTTTLIFSPDHGRGPNAKTWTDHGGKVPESKYIWMAFLGPDTKPLGERSQIPAVTQSQIAATLAQLLGENYNAGVPKAGAPIADVIAK